MTTTGPPDAPSVACPIPPLPVPRNEAPRTALGRWLRADDAASAAGDVHPWRRVLWLTGVDYFSTLGYQPGIALLAAGALSPFATVILVAVTLAGAVPVYAQVARRSFAGQGSIAMLERLRTDWTGRIIVLALLGFAATDFVITITLSAADAAQHAVENPLLGPHLGDARFALTIGLIGVLSIVFLKGFREAIGIATAVALPYIGLNVVVLGRGLVEIALRPQTFENWRGALGAHPDWTAIAVGSALVFPRLALGLSGFETGVSVMPHIQGNPEDAASPVPHGRIAATRKLLVTAAVVMSAMLLLSSFVTTLLVPPDAYAKDGVAAGRAISYLAHEYLGEAFGTVYDLWTIAILWFAGASAMAGLLNLVPRYLPRLGMAPQWASFRRPMVLVLFAACLVVTWAFDADVEAQAGAYATGVLALMVSAAFAVALALWRERRGGGFVHGLGHVLQSSYFWLVTAVLAFTLGDNVVERPDGVVIAGTFIGLVLVLGAASRMRRATELRVAEVRLADGETAGLWNELCGRGVNLVPLRSATPEARSRKAEEVRANYVVEGPMAFLHVELLDNRSEFLAPLLLRVRRDRDDYVVEAVGAVATANTIAYVSELVRPCRLFLGLTRRNLMSQSLRYLTLGEGEVGLKVYEILVRYWTWRGDAGPKPRIFLMSE